MKTRLRSLQVRLNNSIECAKEKFYNKIANKLNDTQKNAKAYWSLIKMLLNNKKIPLIPPLYYDNRFITDFKEKAELFNSFFSKQCSLFPIIAHILTTLIILLKNPYLQSHFQSNLLAKLFKILILIKHMVMIT